MVKKILIGLLVVLIIIQFIRPEKNLSDDQTFNVSTKYPVPAEVSTLLKDACNDCHSNKTTYPWYSNIQPVAWWLSHHVEEGKHHLNLSEFTKDRIAFQNHHFKEFAEQIEKKEMPISSYTWIGLHSGANLTEAQRQTLIQWAHTQMDTIKAHYPEDSLKMPKWNGPRRDDD